jgi:hypothetical protein
MSVLGVVDTEQRCALSLSHSSEKDELASSDRQFPESFVPQLKLSYGDPLVEEKFGLASRRGALIANTIIAPLFLVLVTCAIGYARTKVSPAFAEYGVLAAGRTPSLVAAVVGSLLIDGIFASAIVILTLPDGGPSGADAALAVFGLLASVTIVVIPGVFLFREMRAARGSKHPIACVPAVVRSKDDPEGTRPSGMYNFLFGDEIWVAGGDGKSLELYRGLFATCRGMSEEYEMTFSRVKRLRRFLSTWSFYVEISFTAIAAGGRGWATTDPCTSNKKVQLMQLFINLIAFLWVVAIQPPISPMRRFSDILGNFILTLGSFVLAVLGGGSAAVGETVEKCALASAFK